MNQFETSYVFHGKLLHPWCVFKIQVPPQEFIRPFSRKDVPTRRLLFDVLAQQIHGHRRAHGGGVVRFQRGDDGRYGVYAFLHRERDFVMVRPYEFRDFPSSLEVWTSLETYGKCFDFTNTPLGDARDETRVESTGQEESDVPLRVLETHAYRIFERFFENVLRRHLRLDVPVAGVIAHELIDVAVVKRARWEHVNLCVQKQHRLGFAGERDGIFGVPRVKEGTHAHGVSRGDDVFAVGVHEREVAAYLFERVLDAEEFNVRPETLAITLTLFMTHGEFFMIVYFPVAREHDVVVRERLHPRIGEVVDG